MAAYILNFSNFTEAVDTGIIKKNEIYGKITPSGYPQVCNGS